MASFHRVALGLLVAVIVGGCLAALFPPSCELQGRPVVRPSPVEQPPSPAVAAAAPHSVDLDAIAAGAAVPRPSGWPPFGDPDSGLEDTREEVFVARILPLVLMVDDEVAGTAGPKLWSIRQEVNGGGKLPPEDRLWLSDAFERYQVEQAEHGGADAKDRCCTALDPHRRGGNRHRLERRQRGRLAGDGRGGAHGDGRSERRVRAVFGAAAAGGAPPLSLDDQCASGLRPVPPGPRTRARQGGIPLAGAPLSATLPRVAPGRPVPRRWPR
ncbi:MAG: hypothetical protein U1E38_02135 [Rhodospirillales bacterium]